MADIFISHSSLDRNMADEVCSFFEKNHLKCWVSYRVKDLQPGKDYMERIKEVIDSGKIFIVLLSSRVLETPQQILQEIALANDRQKFGMRIFPVMIDEEMSVQDVKNFAGYVLSGKEFATWSDLDARQVLLDEVTNWLGNQVTDAVVSLKANIPETNTLIGRERELNKIFSILNAEYNARICLFGIGGIGKTALLRHLCHRKEMKQYDTIIYMPIESCIFRTVANDQILHMDDAHVEMKRKTLTDYEYAMYKMALLENSVTENTLVILDNLEDANDPFLDRMSKLSCDLIIAMRSPGTKLSDYHKIHLGEMESMDDIHKLFEFYYGENLEESEYVFLDKLLKDIHFHTITMVLLAKQMRYFGKRPHAYANEQQLIIERSQHLRQIVSESMNDRDVAEIYMQLFQLFNVSNLTREERKVLKTMCILPLEGVQKHLYIELIGESFIPTITKLEEIGWLQTNKAHTIIMIHPMIRDIVMHELEIYIDDPDIYSFVSNFIKTIRGSWNASYQDNLKYKELALSIYYQFPKPSIARYKDYLALSKLFWVLDCMDIGLEIQNKVKMLFVDEKNQRLNSAEEAEAFLTIGFTYQGKGDYGNAAMELEQAAQLYGNRYAAACSHLAQAYMMTGEKTIDDLEPLLQESLSIREKYWSGRISEAASCHLYAKTLSAYNVKLDYALKLEKRAHQIFRKLEPNGVNVSSTSYILGWLYVQLAEDKEDILYGIQKLEEARDIRIMHRGDPLHSWMEDIYLKLGQSYEKLEKYAQAKEYYELLLQVRTNKYKENPSQKQLLESYELLQNIYRLLGDTNGEKECRKYLRYHS